MSSLVWILRTFFLFTLLHAGTMALKNVMLTLEPAFVERFHQCTLRCNYDLEGAALYCVKWYRGLHEFYRYTPNETPKTKVFPLGGISVDVVNSNSTQVVLENVEFNLSGNFTCEVTTELDFSTRIDTKAMQVVELPKSPPTISVATEPLEEGDVLRANCTSPPSRPPATLKFIINDIMMVASTDPTLEVSRDSSWSDLVLELPLTSVHFLDGRLNLRCVAQIGDIYQEAAELRLDSSRDPIPERVRTGKAVSTNVNTNVILICLVAMTYLAVIS